MQKPEFCRVKAYDAFADQLSEISSSSGLMRAAIAIAMHAMEDVELAAELTRIRELGRRVRARVRGDDPRAILAHLHGLFFDELQFGGDTNDYYNPLNSYVPAVLQRRRGIPISLSLIYKGVAEEAGLSVSGINAPGHFLASVMVDGDRMLVDPFFGGQLLTEEEAFQRIEQVTGRRTPRSARCLAVATHRQWLARMLANLQHIFAASGRRRDLGAMSELQVLLQELLV